MKTKIETPKAPLPGKVPYSQAIVAGNFVFTAGSIYLTLEGKLLEGTIEEQVHQIMKNLQAILEAGGVGFADVVKTTIYVTDMSLYQNVNEVYGSYFSDPYPARETVCVKELPLGAKVEISMIAMK
ncbi:MAG: Rid family detoxifying hydrolase [Patescibacteria group bacterium]